MCSNKREKGDVFRTIKVLLFAKGVLIPCTEADHDLDLPSGRNLMKLFH